MKGTAGARRNCAVRVDRSAPGVAAGTARTCASVAIKRGASRRACSCPPRARWPRIELSRGLVVKAC